MDIEEKHFPKEFKEFEALLNYSIPEGRLSTSYEGIEDRGKWIDL